MLCHSAARLFWTRCFIHSNNDGRPIACVACVVPASSAGCIHLPIKKGFRMASSPVLNRVGCSCKQVSRTPHSTTNPLTAAALIYAIGAGITAGAGTRLVLQLLLVGWFKYHPLQSPHSKRQGRYFSSLPRHFGIGQFARLLPSVEVVAISQAPSPESNPNSPYPL